MVDDEQLVSHMNMRNKYEKNNNFAYGNEMPISKYNVNLGE
jgi:hypothetical protein